MLRFAALSAVAAAGAAGAGTVRAGAEDLPSMVGATHWSPCYYLTTQPSLWDGAAALARSGSRAIKLTMSALVDGAYPWNTNWTRILDGVTDLAGLARTDMFSKVLGDDHWRVVDIISYSFGGGTGEGAPGAWNYWCAGFTAADAAAETAEFSALTAHLLSAYAGSGKRFMLEHWEGDWSARCGGYNASQAPDPAVQDRMAAWLGARQAGVDAGRAAWCAAAVAAGAAPATLDCAHGGAVHAAAGVEVLHASEVNLVWDSLVGGFPNNILRVVPRVPLDMVSYSSYDAQARNPGFGQALDCIAAHHNRTRASPPSAVFVAEYGVAQNDEPPYDVGAVYANVNGWALSTGPSGAPRAAHTFAWELFCNEVTAPGFPSQRCNAATGPEFNASDLRGFWLLRPDGSASPSWDYVAGVVNGSVPRPTPPPVGGGCAFTPNMDLQGAPGGPVGAASQGECCTACAQDARCTSAVFQPSASTCWLKYGDVGTPTPTQGVTLCRPKRDAAAAGAGPRWQRDDEVMTTPARGFPAAAFPPEWVAAGGLHRL